MRIPRATAFGFLTIACGQILLFYGSLHPYSDFIGGIIYLVLGSVLPSLIAVSLALASAWLLPFSTVVRIGLAAMLSVAIGLNTSLPSLAKSIGYRAEVSSDVRGRVVWPEGDRASRADVKYADWGAFFVHPSSPRVEIAGDEGCGCFYFLDTKTSLYSNLIVKALNETVGRRGAVVKYDATQDPFREGRDVHIALSFWKGGTAYRALVEVFDRGKKIAAFAHTNIPNRSFAEPVGIGRGNFNQNFWRNATELLLHANIWTALADHIAPSYFPDDEFRQFIADSIPALKPSPSNVSH